MEDFAAIQQRNRKKAIEDELANRESVRLEWGRVLDCEANGCDPVCPTYPDESDVFPWNERYGEECPPVGRINGHLWKRVYRTVTKSPWYGG